jgi:effector-binding domain-containing protein
LTGLDLPPWLDLIWWTDVWIDQELRPANCLRPSITVRRLGTEQPKYRVVETLDGDIEVREYADRIAAETTVEANDLSVARSQGFEIIAGYIFGNNWEKQSIAMTAPVAINSSGKSISMTSPVEVNSQNGAMTMRFFMPASYSMESLPQPTDSRVKLVDVPKESVAVLRYSGSTKGSIIIEKTSALLNRLKSSGWKVTGPPSAYFYNPPWTIPFLRRNEVMVVVVRQRNVITGGAQLKKLADKLA